MRTLNLLDGEQPSAMRKSSIMSKGSTILILPAKSLDLKRRNMNKNRRRRRSHLCNQSYYVVSPPTLSLCHTASSYLCCWQVRKRIRSSGRPPIYVSAGIPDVYLADACVGWPHTIVIFIMIDTLTNLTGYFLLQQLFRRTNFVPQYRELDLRPFAKSSAPIQSRYDPILILPKYLPSFLSCPFASRGPCL